MDLKYRLDNIEQKQVNNIVQQQENARKQQLIKQYFLFSRKYNSNSIRTIIYSVIPTDYIVLLNYLYKKEIVEVKKDEVAKLDNIIENDIIRQKITNFKLNNIE